VIEQELARYTYNAMGQRVTKTASGITTYYLYGLEGELLAELDATGAPQVEYIHLNGAPLAMVQNPATTPKVYYLHNDPLGAPRRATDKNGVVMWAWQGDAFGNTLPDEDPDNDGVATEINLRFPGQYYDEETGLHQNWHRYYDPSTGRYITSDPIGLDGGLNSYTYVGGNPLRWADPFGLAVQICTKFWHPHTFICVDGYCSGKYPSGNPFASPGDVRDDSLNKPSASCSDVPNNKCDQNSFEQCVAKRLSNRGPSGDRYNYMTTNCGQWAEDVIQQCRNECTKK
jgi:RHS repeat-associated protein